MSNKSLRCSRAVLAVLCAVASLGALAQSAPSDQSMLDVCMDFQGFRRAAAIPSARPGVNPGGMLIEQYKAAYHECERFKRTAAGDGSNAFMESVKRHDTQRQLEARGQASTAEPGVRYQHASGWHIDKSILAGFTQPHPNVAVELERVCNRDAVTGVVHTTTLLSQYVHTSPNVAGLQWKKRSFEAALVRMKDEQWAKVYRLTDIDGVAGSVLLSAQRGQAGEVVPFAAPDQRQAILNALPEVGFECALAAKLPPLQEALAQLLAPDSAHSAALAKALLDPEQATPAQVVLPGDIVLKVLGRNAGESLAYPALGIEHDRVEDSVRVFQALTGKGGLLERTGAARTGYNRMQSDSLFMEIVVFSTQDGTFAVGRAKQDDEPYRLILATHPTQDVSF